MTPEELKHHNQRDNDPPYIIDVRTEEEWSQGHIEESHHYELSSLFHYMHEIPDNKNVVLVCRTGLRASTGASLLKKFGFQNIANLKGGMEAWKQVKLDPLPSLS